ncbi:uncharacterized protein LOC123538405 [Mercenaria mercenaria]|uniref:uncharacterized protein LOC123538405 n=1 Tax=Mercenaria mercenaria TaxID=6596 RepID=UPI001E1DCB05|nr:uncharacterized protein LOC123538405 [Mercenaria mercenaria]
MLTFNRWLNLFNKLLIATVCPTIPLPVSCKMASGSQNLELDSKNTKKSNKTRSSNFNADETLKLEELVRENFETLNSKLTNTVTNIKKAEIWRSISMQVSALGYAHRSEKTCMEKWSNLKRKAKEEITKEKIQRRQTGGGASQGSSQQSNRIADLYQDAASFMGISGGLDSDEPDGQHFLSNQNSDLYQNTESDVSVIDIQPPAPVTLHVETPEGSKTSKRLSESKLPCTRRVKRSRNDVLVDYQISYFKGMVERQGLEKELLEVKLRILKAAENKMNELNARELLNLISEQ